MLWPITLCALDIIVETAMGAESDIQFEENVNFIKIHFFNIFRIITRKRSSTGWS